jgi:predicted nucleotidyltransferase
MVNALIIDSDQPLMGRLRDFVSKLDAEIGIEKALLFGSTAKGARRDNSDVDLIIVSHTFENMPEPKRLGFLQHRWRYIEDLEAIAYTPSEFEKVKHRLLMEEILEYAIDLTPKHVSTREKSVGQSHA